MKKLFSILLIVTMFLTEAAYAASVKIGVIDTGVLIKDGVIDSSKILSGKNYVFDNDNTEDVVGHGTRVASLITGTVDGEIFSPSSESLIVPLVYYSEYESGVPINGGVETICKAIYDAVDSFECDVINISSGIIADDQRLKNAVLYAEKKGVLIVSASGNDGKAVYYPAGYDTVIGVGSYSAENVPSHFSCKGIGLDLLADGENLKVVSIKNSDDYEQVKGTSYSTALITSYAAAVLEKYPSLTPSQIRSLMKFSCDDVCDLGYDYESGYGVFNSEKFFSNAQLFTDGELICFNDVDNDAWYYDSVKTAYQNGWMSGTGDIEFEPNNKITRAMFVTILHRIEGEPDPNSTLQFCDVEESEYYKDAVMWVSEKGIVNGRSNSKFYPDDYISREEMAVIMKRYAELKNKNTETVGDTLVYTDKSEISNWAYDSINWAVGTGLISGKENNILDPQGLVTRAETATVLCRFICNEMN